MTSNVTSTATPISQKKARKLLGLGANEKVPIVAKLANAEDEATGDAFEVLVFRKKGGGYGLAEVARAQAFNAGQLRQFLISKNAALPREKS